MIAVAMVSDFLSAFFSVEVWLFTVIASVLKIYFTPDNEATKKRGAPLPEHPVIPYNHYLLPAFLALLLAGFRFIDDAIRLRNRQVEFLRQRRS